MSLCLLGDFYFVFGRKKRKASKEKTLNARFLMFNVGVVGFELTTPWSQTRCANRTTLHPENCPRLLDDLCLSLKRGAKLHTKFQFSKYFHNNLSEKSLLANHD